MKQKSLGKTEIKILPFILGGNVFGWTADEKTSFRILDQFVDFGGSMVDTADVYTGFFEGGKYGESERVIGRWMKKRGNRDQVLISTKVGYPMSPEKKGLSRKYILQAVEDSLNRLQTDCIDLYQSHRDDLDTPMEETLGTYQDLIAQGKIRFCGASQCTPERFSETFEVSDRNQLARYSSLQPLYNLYDRRTYEDGFEKICARENLGVITYFSLARGFLTGKYRTEADLSKSVRGKDIKGNLNPRGLRILSALDEVSQRVSATQAQVALAWVISKPTITAPIASATTTDQLADLLKSVEVNLTPELVAKLDLASRYDP